jgi:hypothetical protein
MEPKILAVGAPKIIVLVFEYVVEEIGSLPFREAKLASDGFLDVPDFEHECVHALEGV